MFKCACYTMIRKAVSLVLIASLVLSPSVTQAQGFVSTLPEPGKMVGVSAAFTPVLVKGMVIHPDQPLNFDFIVDSGNDVAEQTAIKEQTERIAKYFLAAVTVPEDQLWVNLSPYEKDRIIENDLGQTLLGRDMLAQDYVLKQLTASLIYPEEGLGKEFWAKVYAQAQEQFGTTDIPVDTFNKVWIMPAKAEVFEKDNSVYVTDAKLKVMLDSDYTAMSNQAMPTRGHVAPQGNVSPSTLPSELPLDVKATQGSTVLPSDLSKQLIRQIILPAIEKEVNQGKNFAPLRQVYHAAILAKWYRELIQNTLLSEAYVGKNRVAGVMSDEKALKEQIYQRYIAAYKQGVFNYIKEEADVATGETTPKKYFSGGLSEFGKIKLDKAQSSRDVVNVGKAFKVDFAMNSNDEAPWKVSYQDGPIIGDSMFYAFLNQERERLEAEHSQIMFDLKKLEFGSDELKRSTYVLRYLSKVKDIVLQDSEGFNSTESSAPTVLVSYADVRAQAKLLLSSIDKAMLFWSHDSNEMEIMASAEYDVVLSRTSPYEEKFFRMTGLDILLQNAPEPGWEAVRSIVKMDDELADGDMQGAGFPMEDAAQANIQITSLALSANADPAMISEVMDWVKSNPGLTVAGVVTSLAVSYALARHWWLRNTVKGNARRLAVRKSRSDAAMANDASTWKKLAGALGLNWLAYRALNSDNWETRSKAIKFLISQGTASKLLKLLKHKKGYVRLRAALALGKLGDKRAIPVLLEAMDKRNDGMSFDGRFFDTSVFRRKAFMRYPAARALGKLGDKRAIPVLLEYIINDEPSIDDLDLLRDLGDVSAVPMMIASLKRKMEMPYSYEKVTYLESCFSIFGKILDVRAIPVLIDALNMNYEGFNKKAVAALGKFDSLSLSSNADDLVSSLLKLSKRTKEYTISEVYTSSRLESSDDYYNLHIKEWETIKTIKRMILNFGVAVLPKILAVMQEGFLSSIGVNILRELGDSRALPLLLLAINDENPYIVVNAAEALERIGGKSVIPNLIEALEVADKKKQHEVYNAISDALHRLGSPAGRYMYKEVYIRTIYGELMPADPHDYNDSNYVSENMNVYEWQKHSRVDVAIDNKMTSHSLISQLPEVNGMPQIDTALLAEIKALDKKNMESLERMPMPAEQLEDFLKREGSIVFVARDPDSNKVVGYALGLPQVEVPMTNILRGSDLPTAFYIVSRQVAQEERGKGVGTELRKALIKAAKERGFKQIATHQDDIFTEADLNAQIRGVYGVDNGKVVSLYRGLRGEQQYVVFDIGDAAMSADIKGGIDIQNIDVTRKGTSRIQFNDNAVRAVLKDGFSGFTPVFLKMTPMESPLAAMGMN